MNYAAYLFEARSIQGYILDGGRLADQVAASNLVDALCRAPLLAALRVLGLREVEGRDPASGEVSFPRRGGGAFHAVLGGPDAGERARRLRDLWGIAAAAYCPGLEFVHALGWGETPFEAVDDGTRRLRQYRNRPAPAFPEAAPLVRRSPRTGAPALRNDRLPEGVREWSDAATLRKRHGRDSEGRRFKHSPVLTERFLSRGGEQPEPRWPTNLEPEGSVGTEPDDRRFPFLADNAYVAVIHADGNGLGQALMDLREAVKTRPGEYLSAFRGFSKSIEEATVAAARTATKNVLLPAALAEVHGDGTPILPARPIVLGGDDLTLIVRADLAMAFTVAFLQAFEAESASRLAALRGKAPSLPLPQRLTACAGIVFIKSSQPFHLANHLAEELCGRAKDASGKARQGDGPKPASLAFTRITTSVLDESVRRYPLGDGRKGRLGAPAYFLDGAAPRWRDLEKLAGLLARPDLARGPVRELFTLLGRDAADARKRYARWREVLDGDKETKARLEKFDELLKEFGKPETGLPFVSRDGEIFTPLSDALALRAVGFVPAETEEPDDG